MRKKNVITTSLDIQRPAAIEQLEKLSERANVDFYKHPNEKDTYNKRLKAALDHATKNNHDALIVDTAGRLHVDEDLMAEIKDIHEKYQIVVDPHTAVGIGAAKKLELEKNCVVLSTAHPCKFPKAIEDAISKTEKLPESLSYVYDREEKFDVLSNDLEKVKNYVINSI